MSLKEHLASGCGKFIKSCVENNGMFLFTSAAAGWVLCSASQVFALLTNKEIDKEQKKFLVPQEILDGTFNIASYAAITLPLMKGAQALVSKKYPNNKQVVEGAKSLAAIAGGVISSNVITPVLRNKLGASFKEKMEANNVKPVSPKIYDGKTMPNFQARQPLSMNTYINFTKSLPLSGSLKI